MASMEMSDVQCSLILSNEIASVATALRQSSKWAFVASRYEDEDQLDDPLLEEFLSLRQKVLYWGDWELVDPLEYLAPFLDAVKSQDVSGPITGVALASLWKLLSTNVISPSTINGAEAVKMIVSAVRECQFESTGHYEDEAVLMRIIQVLVSCVRSDVGLLLSSNDVQEIFFTLLQWCDVGGPGSSSNGTEPSRVFVQTARHMLGELVSGIFARLRLCRVPEYSLGVGGGTFNNQNFFPKSRSGQNLSQGGQILSPTLSFSLSEPGRNSAQPTLVCGIEPLREMFLDFVLLATSESKTSDHDNVLFALRMIHTAVVSAGESIADHIPLLTLIRQQLFVALNQALGRPPQSVHAAVLQVVLAMYKLFGDKIVLQIECFFQTSLLRLCEGKGCPSQEHQEVALEALLDFCGHPGFLRDMYLNLDCRIERSNLFEDICSLLSKVAFPVKSALGAVHMISLEGLLAMLFTLSAGCSSDGLTIQCSPEPKIHISDFLDIWGTILNGDTPNLDCLIEETTTEGSESDFGPTMDHMSKTVRLEKAIKARISLAADHFNKDFKKGFQYMQAFKLLPESDNIPGIASFLRVVPLLDKDMIGNMFSERDELYKNILEKYTETFNFADSSIDVALRMYLDTFKLPGEAQQVDRVLENFSKVFFRQQTSQVLRDQDAVHVLAFSIVMLNTDLHNDSVKTRMTLEQFIRNNRGLNGKDEENFPAELLESIYRAIERNPMRLTSTSLDIPHVRWLVLEQKSETERGKMVRLTESSALDRDMFSLIWGPTVAAVSVVLDQADDITTVQTALTGLKLAARIASYYGVDEVIDNLVVTLCKFTSQLSPDVPKAAVQFGTNKKAHLATESVFFIANRYGDSIRSPGWRSIMECVIRLYKLGILPENFWEEIQTNENGVDRNGMAPRPSMELVTEVEERSTTSSTSNIGGVFNWFAGSKEVEPTREDREAEKRTFKCIENCNIRDLFRDTKFLQLEALLELVRSITWIPGSDEGNSPAARTVPVDEESATLCLDLLLFIALRNRDRISDIWPHVEAHFQSIILTDPESMNHSSTKLLETAILYILRICQRLLPYKPEVSDLLLRSLELVLSVEPSIIKHMAQRVAMEVLQLVKGAADFIHQGWAWGTICLLLRMTSTSQQAFMLALESLSVVVKDGAHLSSANFGDCLTTARYFMDQALEDRGDVADKVFPLIEDMVKWLPNWRIEQLQLEDGPSTSGGWNQEDCWAEVVKGLCTYSLDDMEMVRNAAMLALHRTIMLGERLSLSAAQRGSVVEGDLLQLVKSLLKRTSARDLRGSEKTLRSAVKTLSKTFLQFLGHLRDLPSFPAIWLDMLSAFQHCCVNRSDELSEAVPEEVKNLLLIMAKEGILKPEWRDADGNSVWDATWRKARAISFSLDPEILKSWISQPQLEVAG